MHRVITIIYCFLFAQTVVLGSFSFSASAQQFNVEQVDFKSIRVDELSDSQVQQFINRAKTSGMTMQELEAQAISRGMPYQEVIKLRERIRRLQEGSYKRTDRDASQRQTDWQLSEKVFYEDEEDSDELQYFGHNLFNQEKLSFEPSFNIPTPVNYVIGAGDEVVIEVWGASQQSLRLVVNPEGQIFIPELGPIKMAGLTVGDASKQTIQRLSTIYSGIRGPNPNTFAQVSLGQIRSINVTVAGDVYMPGTFTLPAYATVFNALYYAGGPNKKGSLREINLIRNGRIHSSIDLYSFLVKGEMSLNERLRDEDLVFVTPIKSTVSISGEIIRPALYEMKGTETIADLISYAGSFTHNAYKKSLVIDRITETQRKLLNLDAPLFSSVLAKNGDIVVIDSLISRYENRVSLTGAVYKPGIYALSEGLTLTQLINTAEGLREDAFRTRAAIYRLDEKLDKKVIGVNIGGIVTGLAQDIVLHREDSVVISSHLDLREPRVVSIYGEVLEPGEYQFANLKTLGELVRKSGGFTDAASSAKVEIARRVSNPTATSTANTIAEVFTFAINRNLSLEDEGASFELKPFDIVFIRRSPGYLTQQLIEARGEFNFPGEYAISRKGERVSELVKRAGGFTDEAYLRGATLLRVVDEEHTDRIDFLSEQGMGEFEISLGAGIREESSKKNKDDQKNDSKVQRGKDDRQYQAIGINLQRILQSPNSNEDLILIEGDILEIPQQLQTVRLSGALLNPVITPYQHRTGVREYVGQAGGFAQNAKRSKVFVIYPNGSVDRTRNFLLFRSYPSIEPGAEIIVPERPEREQRSIQETLAISSAMSSLALVIVTLIGQL